MVFSLVICLTLVLGSLVTLMYFLPSFFILSPFLDFFSFIQTHTCKKDGGKKSQGPSREMMNVHFHYNADTLAYVMLKKYDKIH